VVGGTTYANQRHKVKTTYDDNLRRVTVESDLNTEGDFKLKTRTTTDELGRATLVERSEDGTTNYAISAQTVYVQMGKITLGTNPKRSAAAATDGWTRATRDELGRVTEVATFYGTTQPPDSGTNSNWTGSVTSSYNAHETTVTDQAGKVRKSVIDGLGRLAQVTEDPSGLNYQTSYTYDTLNNLLKVVQGTQTRYFGYDSLSRLIRARNPEQAVNSSLPAYTDPVTGNNQWAMAYAYDLNSNLTSKTNARNITTNYTYDGLNRNTTVSFSSYPNGTFYIERFYDGATNGKGRFWYNIAYNYKWEQPSDNLAYHHTKVNGYDAVGRPLDHSQQFLVKESGNWVWKPFNLARTYDLAGNVTSQTYPSGRTVNYTFDNAGRLSSFTGTLGDGLSRTYADSFSYTASGQMTRERFGTQTQLYHRMHYTARGQVYDIRLGTDSSAVNDGDDPGQWTAGSWNRGALRLFHSTNYVYGNGGVNNNGNLYRMTHFVPGDDADFDNLKWPTLII
jgi:YD repeat-containing protein